jgi:type III pantothenate kinase
MLDSKSMDPILVVDIGNTNIVCAVFQDGKIVADCRMQSATDESIEGYHSLLGQFLPDYPFACFKHIVLGSVVPALTSIWQELVKQKSNARLEIINGLSPIGLQYIVADPSVVGADLVANAFEAWQSYPGSTIVIDLGTATTIQLINREGLYAGVSIAPGMKTAASQLFANAAQLSGFELLAPQQTLGNNTTDALRSGIVLGHAIMIQGFVELIKKEYSQYKPYTVVLTGGLSSLIAPLCPSEYVLDKELTLRGLHRAFLTISQRQN